MRIIQGAFCALAGLIIAAGARAETLTYTLTPRPDRHALYVELVWETGARAGSVLATADRWGAVADVPALLRDVQIAGAERVRTEGTDWTLTHRPRATITCRYTVVPPHTRFDWPTVHYPIATGAFFHGIGSTFLLTPRPGGGGAPDEYEVLIRWRVPKSWKAVCSWALGTTVGARLRIDDLRNSVYLAGPLAIRSIDVEGASELTIALIDGFGFDAAALEKLAAETIAAQCMFMSETQFPPFIVTAVPVGAPASGGHGSLSGTGLYQSFALFLPPGAALTDGVEHLFAHELFHHWNGRILQRHEPEELVYWFTEGFTDYYSLRILYESGRWSAETYAKWINRHIGRYFSNPARNATNEEIRAGYWKQRDTVGELPYQRGLLLALRWHRLARQHGVTDGLDRLFKSLVNEGRTGLRISNEELWRTGRRLLGDWFDADFERYVIQAETVDVPPDALAPDFVGAVTTVYAFELGFDRERSLSGKRICGLVPGSAAVRAGLREQDELTGWSIGSEAEDEVTLRVRRSGEIETIRYYPRGAAREILQFSPRQD